MRSKAYWLACVVFLLASLLDYFWLDFSAVVDQRGSDWLIRQHAATRAASSQVVVIDIDQRSLERMNAEAGSWPWPRSVHGELLTYLKRQGATAVVFDILFNEPDQYRPEHDAAFAEAVAQHRGIYFATSLLADGQGAQRNAELAKGLGVQALPGADPQARAALLQPMFSDARLRRGGLINFSEDSDLVGRHYLLYQDRLAWRFPSLPTRLAQDHHWSLPHAAQIRLNWRASWQHYGYADIYADANRSPPTLPASLFAGKVVVVGTAAPGLQDLRLTPMSATYPGVDILATALSNLQEGDWLRERTRPQLWPLLLVYVLAVSWAFARGWSAARIGMALLLVSGLSLSLARLALVWGWWLPLYAPLAWVWLVYWLYALRAYLLERAHKEQAVRMFSRFLDPRVVGELVARGEVDSGANAASREITILFSDIRGFTSLSETRSPPEVVALLNRYFSEQVEIVFRHGGTLDKFIGDAIMAFWGAPLADPHHAQHAIAAALEMSEAVSRLRSELGEAGMDFEIGIGLNSGPAVVGFIGAKDRLDYTAIGDTVNLASRIEGQTKGIARVLIAESTRQLAGDVFVYRDCGLHHVKGREQEVRLFAPSKES